MKQGWFYLCGANLRVGMGEGISDVRSGLGTSSIVMLPSSGLRVTLSGSGLPGSMFVSKVSNGSERSSVRMVTNTGWISLPRCRMNDSLMAM